MFPSYSLPRRVSWGLAVSVLSGRRRSFRRDGLACMARLEPPLQVVGQENIPKPGPGLLLFNHYYRPGFNAWWMAFAMASVVPVDIHFIMTGELTYPGKWYAPLGMAVSRWVLERIRRVYGFTTMPPMPPRPKDMQARADSVRRALDFVKNNPNAIIGLAPEGGDQPGGVLTWPPSGAGRFISLLASGGMPIVPVGVFEEAGCLSLSFGEPYHLTSPAGFSAHERDHQTAETAMRAIAGQLPNRLRGEFAQPK